MGSIASQQVNDKSGSGKARNRGPLMVYAALGVIVGMALLVRWWSDSHQPPLHPLKVTVTARAIPQKLMHSVSDDYFAQGEFAASDNMRELAQGRYMEGGATVWHLVDIQWRASMRSPWARPAYTRAAKPLILPLELKASQDNLAYERVHWFADQASEWKFTVRATRKYYDPDTKAEWQGSGEFTLERTLIEDIKGARRMKELAERRARGFPDPTPTPPPGVHAINPEKAYVADIQWSPDQGQTWRKIPQKGEKGFPAAIKSDLVIGFRAVKKHPKEPWPDWSGAESQFGRDEILVWQGDIVNKMGLNGEEVWISPLDSCEYSLDANDLRTITLRCGNTVKRQVQVLPPSSD